MLDIVKRTEQIMSANAIDEVGYRAGNVGRKPIVTIVQELKDSVENMRLFGRDQIDTYKNVSSSYQSQG